MASDPVLDMADDEPDNDVDVMPGVHLNYFGDMPFVDGEADGNPGSHGKKRKKYGY